MGGREREREKTWGNELLLCIQPFFRGSVSAGAQPTRFPYFFNSFKMGVQNFEITFQGGEPDERMVFNGGSTIVGTVRFTVDEEPKDTRGGTGQ